MIEQLKEAQKCTSEQKNIEKFKILNILLPIVLKLGEKSMRMVEKTGFL